MSHRLNRFRLKHFYHYLQRVFDFQGLVRSINDFRAGADIPTERVFEALVLGFALHFRNLRALAFEMLHGRVRKVLRHRTDFHINSLRYVTEQFDIATLDAALVSIRRKMKRAKCSKIPSMASMWLP